jgi:hypothetical protein
MSAHKIVVSVVAIAAAAVAGAARTCCGVPEDRLALRLPVACGSRLDQEDVFTAFERAQTTLAFGF